LEGLEISEIGFASIAISKLFRLESEFYTVQSVAYKDYFLGEDIIDFVQYGTSKALNEECFGYPILRLNEFNSTFISKPSKHSALINKEEFISLRLKKDDVLICRTNGNPKYVGKSGLVPFDTQYGYASYLFKIRPKAQMIRPSTLVVYLNSKYGRAEVEKYSMTSNQVNFSPAKFKQIKIPKFDSQFNASIEEVVYNAHDCLMTANVNYIQAEQLLLKELGLENFKPETQAINVKSLSQSFGQTGRLDAEYYQKKYDQFLQQLEKNNCVQLSEVVNIKKSIEPGSKYYQNTGIDFVRVSDTTKFGIRQTDIKLSYDIFGRDVLNLYRPTNDTILLSKDGTVGIAYKIKGETKIITSGALLHLVINDAQKETISPEYLTLVLNSIAVNIQAERDAGGSIIQHWKPSEINNVIIPVISKKQQDVIENKIKESFQLRKKSKHLLEVAKQAVEMAIEKNEKEAMQYIEKMTREDGVQD
jgi:type I restriction enzyme S subunit